MSVHKGTSEFKGCTASNGNFKANLVRSLHLHTEVIIISSEFVLSGKHLYCNVFFYYFICLNYYLMQSYFML